MLATRAFGNVFSPDRRLVTDLPTLSGIATSRHARQAARPWIGLTSARMMSIWQEPAGTRIETPRRNRGASRRVPWARARRLLLGRGLLGLGRGLGRRLRGRLGGRLRSGSLLGGCSLLGRRLGRRRLG